MSELFDLYCLILCGCGVDDFAQFSLIWLVTTDVDAQDGLPGFVILKDFALRSFKS